MNRDLVDHTDRSRAGRLVLGVLDHDSIAVQAAMHDAIRDTTDRYAVARLVLATAELAAEAVTAAAPVTGPAQLRTKLLEWAAADPGVG